MEFETKRKSQLYSSKDEQIIFLSLKLTIVPFEHLYIIGNGFDLHHQIKSTYKDFNDWLIRNGYIDVTNKIDEIFGCNDIWWMDFEKSLGDVNLSYYARQKAMENQPNFASDDFRDADWYDAEICIENEMTELISFLKDTFSEWIDSLNAPNKLKVIPLLKKDSFFINFNYTDTLESLYRVSPHNIWHPHGYVRDLGAEYIIGHGKSRDILEKEMEKQEPQPPKNATEEELSDFYQQTTDFVIERAKDETIFEFSKLQKPVVEIIESQSNLWGMIHNVQNVYIYGYSFSEIDEPYLNKIIQSVNLQKVQWEISVYSESDKKRVVDFIQKHNLPKTNIHIVKLSELMCTYQLSLPI